MFFLKLAITTFIAFSISSCQERSQKQKTKKKPMQECLKRPFKKYAQGKEIGGIKICHKRRKKNIQLYVKFEKERNNSICFIPMHKNSKHNDALGDSICVEHKKDKIYKIRFKDPKTNSLFIVSQYKNALNELRCCLNASHSQQEKIGIPYSHCTFEYKRHICAHFLKENKGHYIHQVQIN